MGLYINDITENGIVSTLYSVFTTNEHLNSRYWKYRLKYGQEFTGDAILQEQGRARTYVREVQIDWQTVMQFASLTRNMQDNIPIFVKEGRIYNSTVNGRLERLCRRLNLPVISIHGFRHTHASLLLFDGVSIASVARRLGHASMTTTQKTYLHIIQELENQDIDRVMRAISSLS